MNFGRGQEGINNIANLSNNVIKKMPELIVRDNEVKHVLFLCNMSEVPMVPLHKRRMLEPKIAQSGKSYHEIMTGVCLNALGTPCPLCGKGERPNGGLFWKVFDFEKFTTQQGQEMIVGVRPLVLSETANKTLQTLDQASGGLKGKVVKVWREKVQKGKRTYKEWRFEVDHTAQIDLGPYQQMMNGFTDQEVVDMASMADQASYDAVLPVSTSNLFAGNSGVNGANMPSTNYSQPQFNQPAQNNNPNFNQPAQNQNNQQQSPNFNTGGNQNNGGANMTHNASPNFNPNQGGSFGGNHNPSIGQQPEFNTNQNQNPNQVQNNPTQDYNVATDPNFTSDDIPF